jgi:hypothetical protein
MEKMIRNHFFMMSEVHGLVKYQIIFKAEAVPK